MGVQVFARWLIAVVWLIAAGCHEAANQQNETRVAGDANAPGHSKEPAVGAERLSLRIALIDPVGRRAIDYHQPFRVVFTNHSAKPIRIWNPDSKNGYYQLTLELIDSDTGEKHRVSKGPIENERLWTEWEEFHAPGDEIIEIAPKAGFTYYVRFDSDRMKMHPWIGLPDPNSGHRFRIAAQFESTLASQEPDPPIWTGKVSSKRIMVEFVAAECTTPHDYLRNGFPSKALELMKANPQWIAKRIDYWTPLHMAAHHGHVEVVKWLLENGADVNSIASNSFTPLHVTDHLQVIELILERRPDLSIRCSANQTPLQRAAANTVDPHHANKKEAWRSIVQLFLDSGAPYDILSAIYLDDLDRVKTILGQSPELADNFQDASLLRTAARVGRVEICRYLIAQHRVDVNDFQRGGGYPIVQEALRHPEIVRLLIDNDADLETPITFTGARTGLWIIGDDATLLHFAARDGVPETIELLIDNGVDIFAKSRDVMRSSPAQNAREQTALDVAAFFGRAENAEAIVNHPRFDLGEQLLRQKLLDRCLIAGVRVSWGEPNANRPKLVDVLRKKGVTRHARNRALEIANSQIQPTSSNSDRIIKQMIAILNKNDGNDAIILPPSF